MSYLKNYWVNRPECQRVVLTRLRCADYTVVSSICNNKCFKHSVISQKLLAQSALVSTRCAEQVRCVDYTVVSSICNNKCFKHLVISQKLLAQSALVSTRCAEQVRCVDYTVVSSICKNKVLLSQIRTRCSQIV